jgi:nicotinamidase-related amidase
MNTALLLIDIQNDYFENGASALVNSDNACKNVKCILNYFREKRLPVIHIQHHSIRPGSTFFLPGTKGAEIHADLTPLEGEKVITKYVPNSFRDTGLLEYLKEYPIQKLIICGMMTHMCVDATVRAAKDLGFEITLIGDACATKDLIINGDIVEARNVQNSFLAALNYFYSQVITTEQFLLFV